VFLPNSTNLYSVFIICLSLLSILHRNVLYFSADRHLIYSEPVACRGGCGGCGGPGHPPWGGIQEASFRKKVYVND